MPSRDEITEFSHLIERLADQQNVHCVEAIVQYCEDTGIEIEVAATLITTKLKARIREEAQSINLLKKTSKLPL
jgi:hypothetical protein